MDKAWDIPVRTEQYVLSRHEDYLDLNVPSESHLYAMHLTPSVHNSFHYNEIAKYWSVNALSTEMPRHAQNFRGSVPLRAARVVRDRDFRDVKSFDKLT